MTSREQKFSRHNGQYNKPHSGGGIKRNRSNYSQTKKNSHLNNNRNSYSNVNSTQSNTQPNAQSTNRSTIEHPSVNLPCLSVELQQNYIHSDFIQPSILNLEQPTIIQQSSILQPNILQPNNSHTQDQTDEVYYNPNNRLLTKDFVELTLFNVIGQKFSIHNLHFYQTAFVHASAYKKNIAPPNSKEPLIFLQTYESLEFMGDSWLGAIVTDYLYHRFPGQKEGFLTKVRAKIVREQQLIKFSEQLNFHRYVILPIKAEKMLGRKGAKFLEDVFEAFCAALIEDLGVAVLQLFIKHMLERNVDFNDLILFDDDYKSMLLQFHQRHGWPHPTYRMINQEGPGHKKQFIMGVDYIEEFDYIESETPLRYEVFDIKTKNKNHEEQINQCKIFVTGKGKSKKEAEQAASKEALEAFGMMV